jgi:hypothetical protein
VGLCFRKRIGLGPLAPNFSKSGIGISTGVRGLRGGISSHRGVYTSLGLPGPPCDREVFTRERCCLRDRLSTALCDLIGIALATSAR